MLHFLTTHPTLVVALKLFLVPLLSSVLGQFGAWLHDADTPQGLAILASRGPLYARLANLIAGLQHAGNCNVADVAVHALNVVFGDTTKIIDAAAAKGTSK